MKDSSAGKKGITLIELLTVIFILGLVSTLAYQVAREGMSIWTKGRARFETWHSGRQLLEKMTRELQSTYPLSPSLKLTFAKGKGESSYPFEGSSRRIQFVSTVSFPPARISGKPGLGEIEYSLERTADGTKGGLRRRVKTLWGTLASDSLEPGIVGLKIRYWKPTRGWVKEWKQGKGPGKGSLPQAVEITIRVKEGQKRKQLRTFSTVVYLPVTAIVKR